MGKKQKKIFDLLKLLNIDLAWPRPHGQLREQHDQCSQHNQHNRGSALIMVTIFFGLFGAFLFSMQNISKHMTALNYDHYSDESRESLKREVDLLFGRRDLCIATLKIAGDRFYFKNLLKGDEKYLTHLVVNSMSVVNTEERPILSNVKHSQFIINYKFLAGDGNWRESAYSKKVHYTLGADGGVTECYIEPDIKKSCEITGAIWSEKHDRCDICNLLGGRFINNKGDIKCII